LNQGNLLEFRFQNPKSASDPLIVEKVVEKEQKVNAESPEITTEVKKGEWFKIVIIIYTDSTKQSKLGDHHQLVRAEPQNSKDL